MRIEEVTENKKQYLDLLLLADEQEDMVDRYLYKGKMYVLDDDGVKCECVVTDEGNGITEHTRSITTQALKMQTVIIRISLSRSSTKRSDFPRNTSSLSAKK